jgi:triosephosphate isomerase
MKPLIIANWKCNPMTLDEAKILLSKIKEKAKDKNVVIVPPSIFLSSLVCKGIKFGAQNCFWEDRGSFTGEISSQMIKSIGCEYVIVGHSERREIFKETNKEINEKIKKIIGAGLIPILCVGESKEERNSELTFPVIERQIKECLENINQEVIIAYEPIWAIGTGKSASVDKIKEVRSFLKDKKVLYGGSVNSKNASSYIKEAQMDGLLIGGASLDFEEFNKILCDI